MKFVYKTSEELEALTTAELDQYKADLRAHEEKLQKSAITDEVKAQLTKAQEDLKSFLGTEIANQIAELKSSQSKGEVKNFYQSLDEAIKSNKDALIALKDDPTGNVKLDVTKAPQDMTYATNTTGRIGRSESDPTIYGLVRKPRFIAQIISMATTNAKNFTFVNKTGHEGAPAMTAEGVQKPQADWNLVEVVVNPKKLPVIVTVSKEMLDDIDNMAQDVMNEIEDQILDVMENQWINGDGTGNNISGIVVNATPFAAGPLALKVNLANRKDVLRAAIDQVRRANFMPTYILMSTSDVAGMDMEKDSAGQYLFPTFVGSDGLTVKGIPIIESNYIAADKFFVGDFTRYKGKQREGLVLDTGYKTGDWEKNFISFRGETRFFGYIPTNHYGAIVYGTFTTAMAALETP
jgi:HK97 family phage major capsid protein